MSTNPTTLSIKEKAVSFLQEVASGNIKEAYKAYIDPELLHHNPYFRGDADSLMQAMEENEIQAPHKTLEVKRTIQENDTVVVHSHIKQHPDDIGAAVVHIFRFQNERIIEMWDIGQPIPEDSPNKNGAF